MKFNLPTGVPTYFLDASPGNVFYVFLRLGVCVRVSFCGGACVALVAIRLASLIDNEAS